MDNSLYRSDIQELIKEVSNAKGSNAKDNLDKCEKLLAYGEQRRDDTLIGFAHFSMGETYYLMNDMASFYLEILKCIPCFKRIREWGYLAASYNMLGIMAVNRGNALLAMDYYFKAFEYCESYELSDLKCKVHMNIAALYLSVKNSEEALNHLEKAYSYVISHTDMDNYASSLNAVFMGRAKAYYLNQEIDKVKAVISEVEEKTLPHISDEERLALMCMMARISAEDGGDIHGIVAKVVGGITKDITVMNLFDDVYDFLKMLLEKGEYIGFINTYDVLYEAVSVTMIKNLEKKLMELKLEYLKLNNQMGEYYKLSEQYIDILKSMDTENTLMASSALALRNDFYKLKEENEEEKKNSLLYKRKSESDPLTGMSNRLKLSEYAEVAFERSITNEIAFAIELLDIDYFKEYNDNYGHQAGEECLVFIAKTIEKLAKSHLGVSGYRFSGDEFVIIYEGFAEQEVFDIAKELKNAIVGAKKNHEYSKGDVKLITISQGICWGMPKEADNIWEYLHEADDLLYKVKQKSRNSIMLGKAKTAEHDSQSDLLKPIITEVKEEEYLPAED